MSTPFSPRPVVLPEGWEAIEVERIWVRGRPARLVARHGDDRARIELAPVADPLGPSPSAG